MEVGRCFSSVELGAVVVGSLTKKTARTAQQPEERRAEGEKLRLK
jgi:hypothetical protein